MPARPVQAGSALVLAAAAASEHPTMCPIHPHCLSCRSEFVRSDELLSWISAHHTPPTSSTDARTAGGTSEASASGTVLPNLPPTPAAAIPVVPGSTGPLAHQPSRASEVASTPKSGRRLLDISPFEINFFDLQMERVIGRGSFGKVSILVGPAGCHRRADAAPP